MERLELKHLAPYLPYELKIYCERNVKEENKINTLLSLLNIKFKPCANLIHPLNQIKPILRPLSDLTKEINHKGVNFIPMLEIAKEYHKDDKITEVKLYDKHIKYYFSSGIVGFRTEMKYDSSIKSVKHGTTSTYEIQQKLFEWHFDVFGLIPKGLAIDINTIK